MAQVICDLRTADPAWDSVSGLQEVCTRALNAGLEASGENGGEVAILLTGDDEMQALNRDWRGKDAPTDVLAFPVDAPMHDFLGDIAVGHGVCQRDAAEMQRDLSAHLSHLLIHGLLHLYGHDHVEDTEAAEMQALETMALASLGLPDPYATQQG